MSRVYTYIIKSTVCVSGFLYILHTLNIILAWGSQVSTQRGGDDYIFAVFESMI